ncbi:mitochondrial 54S ribosomal protein rml2 [Lithohypha guttulata]|nr:mitochondrial 54S ribosomal protein rml2 [Lithohypha guttulata]
MLQPRLPLRRICCQCQSFGNVVRKGYATRVAEPVTTSRSTETATTGLASTSQDTKLAQSKGDSALRRYIPRTPGTRHLIRPRADHLWKGRPIKSLTYPKTGHARGGRNRTGRITVRHRGGGHKRRIRTVDFARTEPGEQFVERIERDPNRSAHIALLRNVKTKKLSYILAAEGMRAGDIVTSYRAGIPEELIESMGGSVDMGLLASRTAYRGNCLPLGMIPVGTPIFNIAPDKESYGKFARSAGTHGIIMGKGEDTVQKEMVKALGDASALDLQALPPDMLRRFEKAKDYVTVKLTSGEIRLIDKDAVATIGIASNIHFKDTSLGKAGRKRWLGIRPTTRGTAMNTNDHPHGGGRGKSKGNKTPMSPWGVPTKSGYKTRRKEKNPLVVQEHPRNYGKRRRGYA